MPEDLERLVLEGYRAWNTGDRRWVLEHMTPEVEWIPPLDDPDSRTYRGHEEVVRFWDEWRAAVGPLRFDLVEVSSSDRDVLVHARRHGKGSHSGLEVADEVVQIFSFDDEDKCFRVREFYDRGQAMAAVREAGGEAWQMPG